MNYFRNHAKDSEIHSFDIMNIIKAIAYRLYYWKLKWLELSHGMLIVIIYKLVRIPFGTDFEDIVVITRHM